MASIVAWKKDQIIADLATVNGITGTGACKTVDWDIYALPQDFKFLGWQACVITPNGSASVSYIDFKLMGGIDGTNFVNFATMKTSTPLVTSGVSNISALTSLLPYRFIKLSHDSISYGACVNSLASIRVLLMGMV